MLGISKWFILSAPLMLAAATDIVDVREQSCVFAPANLSSSGHDGLVSQCWLRLRVNLLQLSAGSIVMAVLAKLLNVDGCVCGTSAVGHSTTCSAATAPSTTTATAATAASAATTSSSRSSMLLNAHIAADSNTTHAEDDSWRTVCNTAANVHPLLNTRAEMMCWDVRGSGSSSSRCGCGFVVAASGVVVVASALHSGGDEDKCVVLLVPVVYRTPRAAMMSVSRRHVVVRNARLGNVPP
jgi:hypothetical protein